MINCKYFPHFVTYLCFSWALLQCFTSCRIVIASEFVVIATAAHPKIKKDFFHFFFVIYMVSLFTFKIFHSFGIYPGIWCEVYYANIICWIFSYLFGQLLNSWIYLTLFMDIPLCFTCLSTYALTPHCLIIDAL